MKPLHTRIEEIEIPMATINQIANALKSHPVHVINPRDRAHASVALILSEKPYGVNILLIERSANEHDYWSGQVGLPGGRVDASDQSTRHTAERETWEEIGLDLSAARYLGRLSDYAPGGLRIVISCFVYAIEELPDLRLAPTEIADAFWVPLRELDNPALRTSVGIIFRNRTRHFPSLRLKDDGQQRLWGITYRLLRNLGKVITTTKKENHICKCNFGTQ